MSYDIVFLLYLKLWVNWKWILENVHCCNLPFHLAQVTCKFSCLRLSFNTTLHWSYIIDMFVWKCFCYLAAVQRKLGGLLSRTNVIVCDRSCSQVVAYVFPLHVSALLLLYEVFCKIDTIISPIVPDARASLERLSEGAGRDTHTRTLRGVWGRSRLWPSAPAASDGVGAGWPLGRTWAPKGDGEKTAEIRDRSTRFAVWL